VAALFFVSGITGLVAEIVLNKLLTYVFGSSHLATSTVLAAYMAGLSAGAWLFGRAASRARRPVVAYAALELAVGAFYAVLPLGFGPFQRLSIALASPLGASTAALTGARFALSFALVFLPTLLMGGTLPLLVSAFDRGVALRRSLPLLYATNTFGAALGTLLASYALIPALGLDGTLWLAAGLDLLVAVVALVISRDRGAAAAPEAAPAPAPAEEPASWHLPPVAVLSLAFAQGALSFALEVVWSHLIGTVIGVTTYAFALMLFAILLGIGAGSAVVPRLAKRRAPASIFVFAMLALALGVALSLLGWDRFGQLASGARWLAFPGHFWGRELLRLAFCLALLFPAALAMGASLPALAASAREDGPRHGAWVGRVFAANTLGTITGSLVTGFVLLGRLRSERILALAVVGALALAGAALYLGRPRLSRPARALHAALAVAAAALAIGFPGFDAARLTQGIHYYFYAAPGTAQERVESLREDAQSGFISVSRAPDGTRTLKTNGKYEGNDAAAEFQDLFALFGGLYVKRWERAALVGIGPARTLRILYEMPFRRIEAVEFSPAILEAAYRDFGAFARVPFDDHERVSVICDDGRNHLQLSRERYDYVAVAITGAAFSGSSNVYNREFFRAVSDKLENQGVFMLWIQVHHVFPADVRSVVYTLKDVFPSVHFYTDAGHTQGFLLASKAPLTIDAGEVEKRLSSPFLRSVIAHHGLGSPIDLTERAVLTTDDELTRFFASPEIAPPPALFTDLRPSFEYATPYGLASDVYTYDFDIFSDRLLPPFDPPLPPAEEKALAARRLIASHDYAGALELLLEAKALTRSARFDAQIAWVEERTGARVR
jgi:spermidine synthase